MDRFKIEKGVNQSYILLPCLFNLYADCIIWKMTRWMNHKLGVKIFRKNINNLRYSDDTTLMAKSEDELNSFLMSVLEESEKADLKKLNIQKTKVMASSPIISWQIDGKEAETMTDFIFLGSKITADSDCSYEIKRHSLLKRCCDKSSQCIQKAEISPCQKSLQSQSYEFCSYIWMWELDRKESWVLKNWCFWIVALEKTLKSPLICKKIKPVNPKEKSFQNIHWKDWCWSWSSNTLATWFWNWFLWKRSWRWWRLKTKGEGNNQGWVVWVTSPTQWAWIWANSEDGEIQGSLAVVLQSQRFGYFFSDWTTRINT